MASEVAAAPAAQSQQIDTTMEALPGSPSVSEPQLNGLSTSDEVAANAAGFEGNATVSQSEVDVSMKQSTSPAVDSNPAGPTPVDEVAPGIQPVADFVPKEATNISHPTPPPDEPLETVVADVDVEMSNTESTPAQPLPSEAVPQSEQSLVRPREEDGDDGADEPAAKRTRVDEDAAMPDETVAPLQDPLPALAEATEQETAEPPVLDSVAESVPSVIDALSNANVESTSVDAPEPNGVLDEAPDGPTQAVTSSASDPQSESIQTEAQPMDAPTEAMEVSQSDAADGGTQEVDAEPVATSSDTQAQPVNATGPAPASSAAAVADAPQHNNEPITPAQKSHLVERMKNLKKAKYSVPFLRPVDTVALNIPNYFDIIQTPMDLGTLDRKLKSDEYKSIQEFVDDFKLIVNNTRRFNGESHAVTYLAMNMQAYFDNMVQKIPSSSVQLPPKSNKKGSPAIGQEPKRREPRAAAVAAPPPPPRAASPKEPFALQSDGTPQIRRASSNARPARTIKPPQREIPYAKPKRKEHQVEMKFSEHVLDEIRGPKNGKYNHVFQMPVDPVALNIPNYRSIIKQPMDLGTMSQKMKSGQYGTANEVKKDFDLMVRNCLIFNPPGNPVRDLGIALQREFEVLWATKEKWEKKNAPASTRASSASADESDEDEEEEAPEGSDPKTIAALQQQIAAMQSTLQAMSGGGAPAKSSSKSKSKKSGSKKAGGSAPAPKAIKTERKPKRQRLITYEEKDEISKAVEDMDDLQIQGLTAIITSECPKYQNMEEMELEIDDLPNDVQLKLLKYVRDIFGGPTRKKSTTRDYSPDDVAAQDDDDFEPRVKSSGGGAAGKKRKKHAPMNKAQQEEQLARLQEKMQEFSRGVSSASGSPQASGYDAKAEPESSGDEAESSEEE